MPSRDKRHFLTCIAAAGFSLASTGAAKPGPYRFSVVPYLPTRQLHALYGPLVPVFHRALGASVEIGSATDYRQHISLLRAGMWDIVADSLYISRIAQRELGHVPLLRTQAGLEVLIVIPKDSPLRQIRDLQGKSVALTDRTAALGVIGLQYLRAADMRADTDFRIQRSGSHLNSVQMMLAGQAAAAIISKTTLTQIGPKLADAVRVLATPPAALASVVYHVHPKLAKQAPGLREAMLAFAGTPAGQQFIAALGHKGLVPVTAAEMDALDPMVVEFYRQL